MKSRTPRIPQLPLKERAAALRAKYARPVIIAPAPAERVSPFEHIALGVEDTGRLITIGERPRLEHMHVLGAPGSGKSTFLLNCILQDISRGRGACVLDPHGGHPDSLINTLLRFLRDHKFFAANKVHIIAPNIRELVVGFNPLDPLADTDFSVIADALVEAFERAWGDEDTHEKPNIRSVLKATFTALAECRLTLADAKFLYQVDDPHGLRKRIIAQIENVYARDELVARSKSADFLASAQILSAPCTNERHTLTGG